MKKVTSMLFKIFLVYLFFYTNTYGQSRIVCEPDDKKTNSTSIYPEPYFSKQGELCFDVKGWYEYSGKNCVKNGNDTYWKGFVIVYTDDESEGRDLTSFRVIKPMITDEQLKYTIEWTRDNKTWKPMQIIHINRLSGQAVSYFLTEHGGESYHCHLEKQKI